MFKDDKGMFQEFYSGGVTSLENIFELCDEV